jgi:hypothetical protein
LLIKARHFHHETHQPLQASSTPQPSLGGFICRL